MIASASAWVLLPTLLYHLVGPIVPHCFEMGQRSHYGNIARTLGLDGTLRMQLGVLLGPLIWYKHTKP